MDSESKNEGVVGPLRKQEHKKLPHAESDNFFIWLSIVYSDWQWPSRVFLALSGDPSACTEDSLWLGYGPFPKDKGPVSIFPKVSLKPGAATIIYGDES